MQIMPKVGVSSRALAVVEHPDHPRQYLETQRTPGSNVTQGCIIDCAISFIFVGEQMLHLRYYRSNTDSLRTSLGDQDLNIRSVSRQCIY